MVDFIPVALLSDLPTSQYTDITAKYCVVFLKEMIIPITMMTMMISLIIIIITIILNKENVK